MPAPLPEPEPRAEVEPDPQTDLDRAREQAGGQTGDVTVTLLWNGFSDLDLTVVCPDGSRLVACGRIGLEQCKRGIVEMHELSRRGG